MSQVFKWRRGEQQTAPKVGDLVRGAVGVAKAALGVQPAPAEVVRERWAACLACEDHDCGRCMACGCFTGAKVRVAGESCPRGVWAAITVEGSDATKRQCGCGKRTSEP